MAGDEQRDGDPAEAFEELRREVALVRRAVERLSAERAEVPESVDYSETLGRMAHNITAIGQRVDALTKGSAQAMTPDHIAGRIVAASSDARRNDQQIIAEARAGLDQAMRQIAGMVATARRGDEQNRWLAGVAIGGVVLGTFIWAVFAGAVARAVPESWLLPEKMAARTLRLDRWTASRRLAATSHPDIWNTMVAGAIIVQENRAAIERCRKDASKAGEAVSCTVRISPEKHR